MSHAQPQIKYQVRFDWGLAGFQALASAADVIVLADALPAVDAAHGFPTALAAHTVIVADLATSTLVADWALARQAEKGDRFTVAVVAVGERRHDGSIRFAVEDQLVAGAVIDALAERGIDHCSPEAAAAAASFVGLKRAVQHLVKASETGQDLAAKTAAASASVPASVPAAASAAAAAPASAAVPSSASGAASASAPAPPAAASVPGASSSDATLAVVTHFVFPA